MDEKRARKILRDVITDEDGLFEYDPNACAVVWDPASPDPTPELSGHFTADELEAISWWVHLTSPQRVDILERAMGIEPIDFLDISRDLGEVLSCVRFTCE